VLCYGPWLPGWLAGWLATYVDLRASLHSPAPLTALSRPSLLHTAAPQAAALRAASRGLLAALRPEAVALVDAFGFEDYYLNSALGRWVESVDGKRRGRHLSSRRGKRQMGRRDCWLVSRAVATFTAPNPRSAQPPLTHPPPPPTPPTPPKGLTATCTARCWRWRGPRPSTRRRRGRRGTRCSSRRCSRKASRRCPSCDEGFPVIGFAAQRARRRSVAFFTPIRF
jgi:hypothetical protein